MAKIINILSQDEKLRLKALKDVLNNQTELNKELKKSKDSPRARGLIQKEVEMVEVTESATKQIAEYFNGKEVSPIRVFLNEGG